MHAAAHSLIAQSHINDLHRAAALGARRAEARHATASVRGTTSPRAEFAVRSSMVRRLAARFAV
jgi:hypothetical protein